MGIGLLDDRDLSVFFDDCRNQDNAAVDESDWGKIIAGDSTVKIAWRELPLNFIRKNEVACRFNFQTDPQG